MVFFGFNNKNSDKNDANLKKTASVAMTSEVNFVIPYFDVFDPRFQDCAAVPIAVHGVILYGIENIDLFNSLNKTEDMSDEVFNNKLKGTVTKYVKGCVSNAPTDCQIPVVQLERKIVEISDYVTEKVATRVEQMYGIKVRALDITKLVIDKESRGYRELQSMTADFERNKTTQMQQFELNKMKQMQNFDLQSNSVQQQMDISNKLLQNNANQDLFMAQTSLNIEAMKRQQNLNLGGQEKLQSIQLENEQEKLRIQREEMQRASKLQTESTFLDAHQANMDFSTMNNALNKGIDLTSAPAQPQAAGGMPPMPGMTQTEYYVAVNGQQAGPFNMAQLQQFV